MDVAHAGGHSRIGPPYPARVERVEERPGEGGLYVHPGWAEAMPWLVQGITDRTADMSLFGSAPVGEVLGRWSRLRDALDCSVAIHSRQVHEAQILVHGTIREGLLIAPDADGHATARAGALLAISVADCVPISIIAPSCRAVMLLHGGWRGVAAGILEQGINVLVRKFGAVATELHIHLGPAICGECFEVGPEVSRELGLSVSGGAGGHVELRAALAHRALACGVPATQLTVSTFCTRHGDSPFFSHRGGSRERQISVLALRPGV